MKRREVCRDLAPTGTRPGHDTAGRRDDTAKLGAGAHIAARGNEIRNRSELAAAATVSGRFVSTDASLTEWSCMAPTLGHTRQERSKQLNRRRRDYNKHAVQQSELFTHNPPLFHQ